MRRRELPPGYPKETLVDGEAFDDWDGFFYDNEDVLSEADKEAIFDVIHGFRASACRGGAVTTELYCPACHGTSVIAGVLLLAPGTRHVVCPLCGAEFNVQIEFWTIDEAGHRRYEDAVDR